MNPPNEPVTIIGIDCATELNKVGVAVAVAADSGVCVKKVFRGNNKDVLGIEKKKVIVCDLVDYLVRQWPANRPRVLLALDAPLGWPKDMRTKEFIDHEAGQPLTTRRDRMFSRATDRFVRCQTGKKPFDVGADKIAHVAHWTLDLLERLRDVTGQDKIPLAWAPDEVRGVTAIEVYPALALPVLAPTDFGRCHFRKKEKEPPGVCFREKEPKEFGKGYKSKDASGNCPRGQIWQRLACTVDGLCKEPPGTDHEIDAVLCVQIAHDFLSKNCVGPPQELSENVRNQEGWIWFSKKSRKESTPESVLNKRWDKSKCPYLAAPEPVP